MIPTYEYKRPLSTIKIIPSHTQRHTYTHTRTHAQQSQAPMQVPSFSPRPSFPKLDRPDHSAASASARRNLALQGRPGVRCAEDPMGAAGTAVVVAG